MSIATTRPSGALLEAAATMNDPMPPAPIDPAQFFACATAPPNTGV